MLFVGPPRLRHAAASGPIVLGCSGAGTGALAHSIKGGLGSASQLLDAGFTVAALMAVNSHGTVVYPRLARLGNRARTRR